VGIARRAYAPNRKMPKGVLYGTTSSGGGHAFGSVYSFDPAMGVETQVYAFRRASGGAPNDLLAVKRRLYGTTWDAGPHNGGTVFSLRP